MRYAKSPPKDEPAGWGLSSMNILRYLQKSYLVRRKLTSMETENHRSNGCSVILALSEVVPLTKCIGISWTPITLRTNPQIPDMTHETLHHLAPTHLPHLTSLHSVHSLPGLLVAYAMSVLLPGDYFFPKLCIAPPTPHFIAQI